MYTTTCIRYLKHLHFDEIFKYVKIHFTVEKLKRKGVIGQSQTSFHNGTLGI